MATRDLLVVFPDRTYSRFTYLAPNLTYKNVCDDVGKQWELYDGDDMVFPHQAVDEKKVSILLHAKPVPKVKEDYVCLRIVGTQAISVVRWPRAGLTTDALQRYVDLCYPDDAVVVGAGEVAQGKNVVTVHVRRV